MLNKRVSVYSHVFLRCIILGQMTKWQVKMVLMQLLNLRHGGLVMRSTSSKKKKYRGSRFSCLYFQVSLDLNVVFTWVTVSIQAKSTSWQTDTAESKSLRKNFKKHFAFVILCCVIKVTMLKPIEAPCFANL